MMNAGKEFHPATLLFVFVAAIFMILMLTNIGRFLSEVSFGSAKSRSSLAVLETEQKQEDEAEESAYAESVFPETDTRMINLTAYGVTGHNYYRIVDQNDGIGTCISARENLYRRTMKDSECAESCEIDNLCLLTLEGIHPGEAELEYYSCDDSILVGGRLPSYEDLCEVYGEDSDTMKDLRSKLLAKFRIVVDEEGNITAMVENL